MDAWRSLKIFNHVVPVVAIISITALLGFFSAYDARIVLLVCGGALYLLLVFAALDTENIKKVLPLFYSLSCFKIR
ncbi:hypothetical protein [Planococcus koreensis]|uniref:hypothetical protein n=1 Tax=Planococcus koreensis TaxID=112331 RepID=UPI0039FD50CA